MSDRQTPDDQRDDQRSAPSENDVRADDEIGIDPKHPHPQDRPTGGDRSDTDDDTPVERYRDSPGVGASDAADPGEIPEPNEPA